LCLKSNRPRRSRCCGFANTSSPSKYQPTLTRRTCLPSLTNKEISKTSLRENTTQGTVTGLRSTSKTTPLTNSTLHRNFSIGYYCPSQKIVKSTQCPRLKAMEWDGNVNGIIRQAGTFPSPIRFKIIARNRLKSIGAAFSPLFSRAKAISNKESPRKHSSVTAPSTWAFP